MSSSDLEHTTKPDPNAPDNLADESFPMDSIIITKFDPTPQRTHLIKRPQLTAALDAETNARLTLLVAPAGYGKTTLLAEWRRALQKRGTVVGWLSLDEDDSDAPHMMRCLALALARAGLNRALKLATSTLPDNAAARHHLAALLNIVATEPRDVVLILDEFEHLPTTIAEDVVLPCLEKAPPNLHVVIASRETPPLRIASLRSRGLVHEIDAAALRFDLDEIQSLFGDTVNNTELRTLESQTSGWPVAIQLIKGVWSQQDRRGRVLRELETLDNTLTDYLSEQVFSSLPPDIFDLLVRISPVDRISPGVVEFMTGSDDPWPTILKADALAPFLIPVDSSLEVYRAHPLIRAYFRERLNLLPLDTRGPVYRRAARWYARAGRLVSALTCAQAARDPELAGALIEEAGGLTMWLRAGMPRLQAIMETVAPDALERFPRVRLLYAFLLVKQGKVRESRAQFEQIRKETDNFTRDREGSNPTALKLESRVLESTLLVNECQPASNSYLDEYERSIRRISENDDVFLAHTKNLLAISHNHRGHFDKALQELSDAMDHYRQAGLLHGEFFVHLHTGVNYFAQGQSAKARASYEAARELWRTELNEEKAKFAILKAHLAELEYECSESPPSMRVLTDTMSAFAHCEWWYEAFASLALPLVMTLLATRGLDAAQDELEHCRTLVTKREARGLLPLINATEVSCLALSGAVTDARAKLEEYGFSIETQLGPDIKESPWRQQEAVATAIARVHVRDGHAEETAHFLALAIDRCATGGHVRSVIRLGLQQAIAFQKAENTEAARAALSDTIIRAAHADYIRPFIEEGPFVLDILKAHINDLRDDIAVQAKAGTFVEQLSRLIRPSAENTEKPLLSDREATVIREVAEGLTDKEIARKLDLTPNTVKFHLKNIFRKLGVRNRAHAVRTYASLR